MNTPIFSKNQKLNEVLTDIYEQLLSIGDTEEESIAEIKRYKKMFPNEPDYNLYQYGNLLIYNDNVRALYAKYKSLQKASMDKIISTYKRQIRYIANYIISNN